MDMRGGTRLRRGAIRRGVEGRFRSEELGLMEAGVAIVDVSEHEKSMHFEKNSTSSEVYLRDSDKLGA